MTKKHDGRIAIVSGASSGIGQAAAVRLAEDGCEVVIADRASAEETLRSIKDIGGKATAVLCDVSDPPSVAALSKQVESSVGRCDILVNCAGIYPAQSFDAVSYTHLDVYKRQARRLLARIQGQHQSDLSHAVYCRASVSYTHLDVYKRQQILLWLIRLLRAGPQVARLRP